MTNETAKRARVANKAQAARLVEKARGMCLALEDTYEQQAHGEPTFRIGKRMFAMVANDHHHDGRIALWLDAPPGEQAACVENEPTHFFVPPYVGVRGWIGMRLDTKLSPAMQRAMIRLAYDTARARDESTRRRRR